MLALAATHAKGLLQLRQLILQGTLCSLPIFSVEKKSRKSGSQSSASLTDVL